MATTISPSAMKSSRPISDSRAGWFHILRKRNDGARQRSNPELRGTVEIWIASSRIHSQAADLPPVEDHTGDDEHCRHRQHLRERLRGRPFGGFLHSFSLDSGTSHRCPQRLDGSVIFTRNTPRRVFASIESPLSEYRPCQNRPAIRRQFGPRAAGLCTREGDF